MTQCKDCKYFQPHDDTVWSGLCDITIPKWLNPDKNLPDGYGVTRAVLIGDYCDLGVEK
jgi:hypothetical protein